MAPAWIVHGTRHGRDCGLMENVLDSPARINHCLGVQQIQLPKFDFSQERGEVLPFSRFEIVKPADAVSAANQLMRQIGTDESGNAGDQIMSHASILSQALLRQSTGRVAFVPGIATPKSKGD